jgi:hypothetical protein
MYDHSRGSRFPGEPLASGAAGRQMWSQGFHRDRPMKLLLKPLRDLSPLVVRRSRCQACSQDDAYRTPGFRQT